MREPKCASREKTRTTGRTVFFITPQTRTASRQNAFRYDGSASVRSLYNYFRDCYDPSTGRYCQADPIGIAGGLNVYEYARSNPLTYTDPLGLDPFGSNSAGSGGFTPAPTPFDVFVPGTSANNAFVQSVYQMGKAIKSACSDDPPEDKKKKNCQALKDSILATCASLTGRKKFDCFAAAQESYQQCMSEQ